MAGQTSHIDQSSKKNASRRRSQNSLPVPAGKVPPQNLEAERSVLGGIFIDPEAIHAVLPIVKAEDFYAQAHGTLFDTMSQLSQRSQPIDLVTVVEALKKEGGLEAVGGASYLAQLAEEVFTAANITHYAQIIREKSILRHLIRNTGSILQRAFEPVEQVDHFLDEVEKSIFDVSEQRAATALKPLSDIVKEGFKEIERMYDADSGINGVPTGYHEIDKLLSGLQDSDLVIIAARPSMGKTAFVLNIAQNIAIRSKVPVAIFSLEMSCKQLGVRMLCSEARVDSAKLRSSSLSDEDWIRLTRAAGELSEAQVFIDDTPQMSALEMRAKARRLKARHGLGLVVVDYLQLMRGVGKIESREREISEISSALKAMAKELGIPVIALSQLNRGVESRINKRPIMADLRESGAIEQDADVIAFIYRDEVYEEESPDKGIAEIIIGKHRNGPTGTARLSFLKEYARFENLEYRYDV